MTLRWPPWRREPVQNAHQWTEERRLFAHGSDTLYTPGTLLPDRGVYENSAWVCRLCGETHKMHYGLATVVPPADGCPRAALPIPAQRREDVGALPVVAEGNTSA